MKVYRYSEEESGQPFPAGCINLHDFETTTDPAQADCFLLRHGMDSFSNEQLKALPYLKGNERRHVFFSLREDPDRVVGIPAIIFRADFNKRLLDAGDTTTMTTPWGSPDYGELKPIPEGFTYDVVFQGWDSGKGLTVRACESVLRTRLKARINITPAFYGVIERDDPETARVLVSEFVEGLHQSRLSLGPQSLRGVIRYRFYEAMAMGRVPVLIGDDCIPAFGHKIDYSRCSVRIAEADVDRTGEILCDWLDNHKDDEVIAMGEYGYAMWKRWLEDDRWETTWAELVAERLEAL